MRNRLLLVISTLTVALLLALSMPAHAGPAENAAGEWNYIVKDIVIKQADCNTFITILYEQGVWTGTFKGESTDTGVVVEHCSGKASFKGLSSFEGEVDGKSGTLEMSVAGQYVQGNWQGHWVILSGTEGLANLRGQGTWFGPGAGGPFVWGTVGYAGNYHFEPK